MKKRVAMLLAAPVMAIGALADTETVDGIEWNYTVSGGEACIYNEFQSAAIPTSTSGAITIPATLGGKTVTSIGEWAFYDCNDLTSITIPDCVTDIEGHAFRRCSGLASMTIPNSVTNVGLAAFYGCSALADVTLGNGVTDIWAHLFSGCSSLASVTIPDGVTSIMNNAFEGCSSLTCVTIPNSVTNIDGWVFSGCCALASVTIPDSVTKIGGSVFSGCSGLEEITLPFVGSCRGNTGSFESLFGYIFGTSSYVGGTKTRQVFSSYSISCYIPSNLRKVVITDETQLGYGAFYNCGALTSVTIPDSVTSIGDAAFFGCSELTSVTIGAGVTSIGEGAFYCCFGLTSVCIADIAKWCGISFASLDANPLYYAKSLFLNGSLIEDVTIPDVVTTIGGYAFYNCTNLLSVTISDNVTHIGDSAFDGCFSLTRFYVMPGDAERVKGLLANSGFPASDGRIVEMGVAFEANGGIVDETSRYVVPGCVVGELPVPTRTGYEFSGWWTTASGGTQVTAETIATRSVTYYAHWTVNQYTVTFNANGGTGGTNVTQTYGTMLFVPTVTRLGYTFGGWSPSVPFAVPASNVTYYAQWTARRYKVSFDRSGGSGGTASVTATYENAMPSISVPTRAGYTFGGYWTGKSGRGTQYYTSSGRSVRTWDRTEPTTLYAKWTTASGGGSGSGGSYPRGSSMPVTIVGSDGRARTLEVTVGQAWGNSLPAAPAAPAGQSFYGWYTGANGTGTRVTATSIVPDKPVTLYPHFVENEVYELYESVSGEMPIAAASEYNGYLFDARRNVTGTIQIKVGKPNAKTGLAAVKAVVQLADGTKKNIKGAEKGKVFVAEDDPTEIELVGGEACEVTLGERGLSGKYGSYTIDGARNFFASKDKGEQGAADAILGKWLGAVNVVWSGGSLSVAIAKKGKAKVAGMLADGKTKVSGNTVFLVGEDWCCVPVVAPKAGLAFALWLSHDGRKAEIEGLGDGALVGSPGTLKSGAKFHIDAAKFAAAWGQAALPYLPDGVAVTQSGTKWTLPKAGKVAYGKDGTVDESKLLDNPSGLKLTYKAKDGSFKGSFKAYADVGGKPKATTVNVTGFLVGGVGYGTATVKGKGSVSVEIK